ncbi:hypothetical protein GCM10009836_71480 [Pseudonocardia ailaonensis]|uniref:Peptidase S8/S53 domain-containing protein n=1 Tax=Pseudonocardia ailaonensis TaxID=367279 RepID=A0ABN2NPA5_9PSEU
MPARVEIVPDAPFTLLAEEQAGLSGLPIAAAGTTLFVADTALVNADDPALAGILASRPDLVLETFDLPEPPPGVDRSRLRSTEGMPRLGRLRFPGAAQSVAPLADLLDEDLAVSSARAAGTLAVLADLAAQGLRVSPDVVGTLPALPPSSSSEQNGSDAYRRPEFTGPTQIARAWQLVDAYRSLNGPMAAVQIGVIDSGFWLDATGIPLGSPPWLRAPVQQWDLAADRPPASGAAGPTPWHGTGTAALAVAPHDDMAGIAGVGGTVATPFLFRCDRSVSQIIRGVQLCTAWGVDVINISISMQVGHFGPFDSFPDDDFNDMFSWARRNGVVIVASAGNDGAELPDLDLRPQTRTPGVITVGGLNGPAATTAMPESNYGVSVDIWAPGRDVRIGPDPTSAKSQKVAGTSYSSPIVAGVAAMLKAIDFRLDVDAVQQILQETGWVGTDGRVTRGVDAAAAVWKVMGGRLPDDGREPNNSPGAAVPLLTDGAGGLVPNTIGSIALSARGDQDWYRFDVAEFSTLDVTLDVATGIGPAFWRLEPEDPNAAVSTLRLGGDDAHQTGHANRVPPGRYRIVVSGGPTVYDLRVALTPRPISADDFEDNDTPGTGTLIQLQPTGPIDPHVIAQGPGTYDLTLDTSSDVDYFRVEDVPRPSGHRKSLVMVGNADSPVEVTVMTYDGSRPLRTGTGGHDAVVLNLEPPKCLVRVRSTTGVRTRYSITFDFMVDVTVLPPIDVKTLPGGP